MTKYDNGSVMFEGNPNSDKKLFVLSGQACTKLQVNDRDDWLMSLLNCNATISRIDLAMTTDVVILEKFVSDYEKIVSKQFQSMKVISDHEYTPQTIYCGDMSKRGKNGIVRAYDKALQLNISGIMQRVEIELKRKDAHIASKRLAIGESIQSVMNSKFRIDSEWYQELFGNDVSTVRFPTEMTEEMPEIERKMLWLESQVLPSLQYVIDYDKANGTSNFARILDKLIF